MAFRQRMKRQVLPCIDSISAQTQGSIRRITRLNYDARALTPGCSKLHRVNSSSEGDDLIFDDPRGVQEILREIHQCV